MLLTKWVNTGRSSSATGDNSWGVKEEKLLSDWEFSARLGQYTVGHANVGDAVQGT